MTFSLATDFVTAVTDVAGHLAGHLDGAVGIGPGGRKPTSSRTPPRAVGIAPTRRLLATAPTPSGFTVPTAG